MKSAIFVLVLRLVASEDSCSLYAACGAEPEATANLNLLQVGLSVELVEKVAKLPPPPPPPPPVPGTSLPAEAQGLHELRTPPPIPSLSAFARWGTVVIYAIAWLLMMWPRWIPLGRPATALVFAIFAALFRAACTQSLTVRDLPIPTMMSCVPTLCLLFGLMIVCAYLQDTGAWNFVEHHLDRPSPQQVLIRLCICSSLMSAILMNDAVCLVMPPIALRICAKRGARTALPFLIAISTSANIGSGLTIVGNPQNALIASFCPGITFTGLAVRMLLPVALGMSINIACILVYFQKDLFFSQKPVCKMSEQSVNVSQTMPASPKQPVPSVFAYSGLGTWMYIVATAAIVIAMIVGWFVGLSPAYMVNIAAALLIFVRAIWRASVNEKILETETEFALTAVDFTLGVLFMGQFILVGFMMSTGLPPLAFDWMLSGSVAGVPTNVVSLSCLAVFVILVCNVLGNVPAIVMLRPVLASLPFVSTDASLTEDQRALLPTMVPIWILVSWIATVSGNFTMLGSAANQIVAHVSENHGELSYNSTSLTRFSFVPTAAILLLGTLTIASETNGLRWPYILGFVVGILSLSIITLNLLPGAQGVNEEAREAQGVPDPKGGSLLHQRPGKGLSASLYS